MLGFTVFIGSKQRTLTEPRVEVIPKSRKRILNRIKHHGIATLTEIDKTFVLIRIKPFVAICIDNCLGNIFNVGSAIASLWHFNILPQQLLIANDNRVTKYIHLVTLVIDVEFLVDRIASMAHNASNSVAKSSPATMTNMHRTGGISGNILKIYLTGLRELRFTEIRTLLTSLGNNRLKRCIR